MSLSRSLPSSSSTSSWEESGRMDFSCASHASDLLSSLRSLLVDRLFCDVVLRLDDGSRFPAHKTVLGAASPYFKAMFSHGLAESESGEKRLGIVVEAAGEGGCEGEDGGKREEANERRAGVLPSETKALSASNYSSEIELRLISSEIFGAILDFVYTGKITIHEDNVQDILSFADMYQIDSLLPPCEQFLLNQLHPSNALGILLFAESHSLPDLRSQAQAYLHHNFLQVVVQEEFFSLPKDPLMELLESENLRVENEMQVLSSVVSWILHDVVTRRRFAFEVIRPVRFLLIPHRQLHAFVDAINDFSLKIALKKHLQDFKAFFGAKCPADVLLSHPLHASTSSASCSSSASSSYSSSVSSSYSSSASCSSSKLSPHLLVPRKSAKKFIFVIAGYQRQPGQRWSDSEALRVVEQFDSYKQEWKLMPAIKHPRNGHGAAAVAGSIYVIGGESDSLIYDTVEKYDCHANKWSAVASMTVPRCNHGVVALDQHVYALGGWVGSEIGSTIERFSPVPDFWQVYGTMPRARYAFGIVAHQGLIYVAGGCNDNHELMDSFDAYNPVIKEWTSLAPLPTPRCFFALVALDDHIYALGGQSGPSEHDNALDVCDRYSFCDRWPAENRQLQHSSPRRQTGVWETLKTRLPSPRAGHSAVAVNGCLFVVGGRSDGSPSSAPTTISDVDKFDPEDESWTRVGTGMLQSHCEAATVLI